MRMKGTAVAILAAMILGSVLLGTGLAHPPGSVELACQAASGDLTVTALHGVKNPSKHYIERVVVYVDGKKAAEQTFTGQTSGKALEVTLAVGQFPAGTEIRVEATCNIFGTGKATLIVP